MLAYAAWESQIRLTRLSFSMHVYSNLHQAKVQSVHAHNCSHRTRGRLCIVTQKAHTLPCQVNEHRGQTRFEAADGLKHGRETTANRWKKKARRKCSSSSCHTLFACMITWVHIFPAWNMQFLAIDTTIANAFDHLSSCWVMLQFLRAIACVIDLFSKKRACLVWYLCQTILVCLHDSLIFMLVGHKMSIDARCQFYRTTKRQPCRNEIQGKKQNVPDAD